MFCFVNQHNLVLFSCGMIKSEDEISKKGCDYKFGKRRVAYFKFSNPYLYIFHRIMELLVFEGTSGDHPGQDMFPGSRLTQEHVQVHLECLQRGRIHDLPGQLFQCSATLNVKKFFLMLR